MIIHHQFIHSHIRFPIWEVDTLFLGTFNPSCGQQLDYYYKRPQNGFWKILKHYDVNNDYDFNNIDSLIQFMTIKGFGCIDIIETLDFPDEFDNQVCGQGYSDSILFTVNGFIRTYIFDQIQEFIIQNNVQNVFSTWGTRNNPVEFRNEVNGFQLFCHQNNISFTRLKSPSGRLYRGGGIDSINNNWWENLDPIFDNH